MGNVKKVIIVHTVTIGRVKIEIKLNIQINQLTHQHKSI
jgi:hypothetical protein